MSDQPYDYLIVGAGLFGAVFAREAADAGKKVLVIDRRDHIAGNAYSYLEKKIHVHKYGAHIFHTNSETVWNYLGRFAKFNRFTNTVIANYKGEIYSLPFNMYTFNRMWNVSDPKEAQKILDAQRAEMTGTPQNLEEQAISLVGRDIYEKLIKGYTEKQWGRPCSELPSFIIRRLPVRLTYDNNYFNALYQGIPIGGYTKMVERMLEGIEVRLNTDYLKERERYEGLAKRVLFTGPIDEYYDYCFGPLAYRSLRIEFETLDTPNFQGNAAVNYTDAETPFTRIIEYKWFEDLGSDQTIISKEYPMKWEPGKEAYYPVNDEANSALYARYKALADQEPQVFFGGRLGEYRYYDMDQVVASALACAKKELSSNSSDRQS